AALALIERGIQAQGGADALQRSQVSVRRLTGVLSLFGNEVAFSEERTAQLPERVRTVMDVGSAEAKTHVEIVVNGDKGWQLTGGAAAERSKDRLDEIRGEANLWWLATLVPLARDTSLELAVLPEATVNGQPAAGVKVARKGQPDLKFYFDKGTGLL